MLRTILGIIAMSLSAGAAAAQEPLKIGLVQSMTGPFNTVGKAVVNGARLYVQQHGDTVAGRKIQIILRDDATSPDSRQAAGAGTHRQRQGRDHRRRHHAVGADHRAAGDRGEDPDRGDGVGRLDHGRSLALHDAHQLHARPIVVGHRRLGGRRTARRRSSPSSTTGRRASRPKAPSRIASPRAAPQIIDSLRVPLANPDFAPFLQRARDLGPDTLFVYFPGHQARHLRQAVPGARHGQVRHPHRSVPATSPTTTNCPA